MNDATAYGLGIRTKNAASTGPSIMRNIDKRVMSVVSDIYRPFQNRDAFGFMDGVASL